MQSTSTYPFYNKIDNCLEKRRTGDNDTGKEKVSVRRSSLRGHLRGRGCWMQGGGTLVQMEDREAVADNTNLSVSDPYGKECFL